MSGDLRKSVDGLNWNDLQKSLNEWGYAKTEKLLAPDECEELVKMYPDDRLFRSRIDMQRYRFGIGEYKYFADPLPAVIRTLREATYRQLAPIANLWMEQLSSNEKFPAELNDFLTVCARHRQLKPTPLMLRYWEGCYNCLHQDLYGEIAFPLQLTIALSAEEDYKGGDFLLIEQRPRAQSRGESISLKQGEVIIFANRYKPVSGTRGFYRANFRHGVSRLLSGTRFTLGIIFHNAA